MVTNFMQAVRLLQITHKRLQWSVLWAYGQAALQSATKKSIIYLLPPHMNEGSKRPRQGEGQDEVGRR